VRFLFPLRVRYLAKSRGKSTRENFGAAPCHLLLLRLRAGRAGDRWIARGDRDGVATMAIRRLRSLAIFDLGNHRDCARDLAADIVARDAGLKVSGFRGRRRTGGAVDRAGRLRALELERLVRSVHTVPILRRLEAAASAAARARSRRRGHRARRCGCGHLRCACIVCRSMVQAFLGFFAPLADQLRVFTPPVLQPVRLTTRWRPRELRYARRLHRSFL
jgi:hypothetical protein